MEQLSFDDVEVRVCSRCGKAKPITDFPRSTTHAGGYHVHCHACKAEVAASWRQKNPDKERAHSKQRWERERNDPEKRAIRSAKQLERYYRQKAQVFAHYGEACACCGSTESLQMDHINGGGNDHIQAIGNPWYGWLIKNNFPEGFQTLCRLCNQSKYMGPRCVLDHSAKPS